MALVIEPVKSLEQIDAVLAIEEASFTNPWTREMYLAELENPGRLVLFPCARRRGAPIGFCSFWRVLDELHINNLAVVPERRRTGVASALLTFVLDEGARLGARRATLEVRRSNDPARYLYETIRVYGRRGPAGPTTPGRSRTPWSCGGKMSPDSVLEPGEPLCYFSPPCRRRRTMDAQPHDLKDELLRTDEEFHDLAAKHHELEDRLHELTAKHYLSEPEQVEEVTLKKSKLQLKDRMEDILRRHRQEHAHG